MNQQSLENIAARRTAARENGKLNTRRTYRHWTPEMHRQLMQFVHQEHSIREIAVLMNTTHASIAYQIERLGIERRCRVIWAPGMDALLGTDEDPAIASRLGISKDSVVARRQALGIPRFVRPSNTLRGSYYIALQRAGKNLTEIALAFGVSRTAVRKEIRRYYDAVAEGR